MTNREMHSSPGQELQDLLKKLYPADSTSSNSFISNIDDALKAEQELADLIYNSSINYLLRRLITTAEYFNRKRKKNDLPDRHLTTELRNFLKEETRIPSRAREKVLVLLRECLKTRRRKVTPKTSKRVRKNAKTSVGLKAQSSRCYICGKELNFEQEGQYNSAEIEHIWPKAMGGSNQDFNLKVSCQSCNQAKADYIDASDFHYEEISLVNDKVDASFSAEMNSAYKVALCVLGEYRCAICGKPASYVGELEFGRRNPNDSWHFLNIETYCPKHTPK